MKKLIFLCIIFGTIHCSKAAYHDKKLQSSREKPSTQKKSPQRTGKKTTRKLTQKKEAKLLNKNKNHFRETGAMTFGKLESIASIQYGGDIEETAKNLEIDLEQLKAAEEADIRIIKKLISRGAKFKWVYLKPSRGNKIEKIIGLKRVPIVIIDGQMYTKEKAIEFINQKDNPTEDIF